MIDERASQALGRWRRQYVPEGDEPRLGWVEEPLLSLPEGVVSESEGVVAEGVVAEGIGATAVAQGDHKALASMARTRVPPTRTSHQATRGCPCRCGCYTGRQSS